MSVCDIITLDLLLAKCTNGANKKVSRLQNCVLQGKLHILLSLIFFSAILHCSCYFSYFPRLADKVAFESDCENAEEYDRNIFHPSADDTRANREYKF